MIWLLAGTWLAFAIVVARLTSDIDNLRMNVTALWTKERRRNDQG